ncbi:MAG TPA: hypothetical protein EYP33_07810 [Pyrodictium sp.]|nr:hypothetical protein [Pyrodictium sp.]
MRKLGYLATVDGYDSLRPPAFDLMLVVISTLGAVLASIQPIARPQVAARIILDPTLFAVTLFLALRGSSGLAGLVQRGILQVYMSYPVSRSTVHATLFISRVLAPAALLMISPLVVTAVMLWPVVSRGLVEYMLVYAGYLIQAVFYGSVFMMISLVARSPGTSSVSSITFYFAYNVIHVILSAVGQALSSSTLIAISDSMMFYYMMYRSLLDVNISIINLALVPAMLVVVYAMSHLYFTRRFEPR